MSIIHNRVKENFTIVTNEVLRDKNLSWKAKGIYAYLCGCDSGFEVSQSTLATFGNCGRDAIASGIEELTKLGLLEIEQENDGIFGKNKWTIHSTPTVAGKPDNGKPDDGKSATNNTNYNKTKDNNNICSPTASECVKPSNDLIKDFEEWYALYPRKVGRGQAVKAFKSARNKTTQAELMAGLKRFLVAARDTEKNYIPHPATWLNGERWADEDNKTNPQVVKKQPQRTFPTFSELKAAGATEEHLEKVTERYDFFKEYWRNAQPSITDFLKKITYS